MIQVQFIPCRLTHDHTHSEIEEAKMAAEVITSFLPELVTAVSDCVQSVSDQCLAKGLIPDAVYKRVLESGATSEDKARTLVLAVKKSTETDKRCFELFMNILEQELPYAVRDGLLEKMRREANEKASSCTAVVPLTGDLRQIPRGELPRESVVQQTHLLGRLEEAVRQHEHVIAEKISLEEKLKAKTEKCEKLKAKFQALRSETQKLVTKEAAEAKSKIAACESEIENLKERVKEVEKLITEQDMQVKRGRNSVVLRTKDMFGRIAQESHATAWEKARREQETKLKEQEMKINMKDQEMSMKERMYKVTIQEKDDRIREKEYRIREMEAERKQLQTANPPNIITRDDIKHLWKRHRVDECTVNEQFGLELGFTSKELKEIEQGCDLLIGPANECVVVVHTSALPRSLGIEIDDSDYQRYGYHHHARRDISLTRLLEKWVEWYPGDGRGSKTFATYSGLKTALVNAGLRDMARDLRSYNEIIKREREEREREEREKEEREKEAWRQQRSVCDVDNYTWPPGPEWEDRKTKKRTRLSKLKSWF